MISVLDPTFDESGEEYPSLEARMVEMFSEDGPLAASAQFEYRPQQQRMAALVASALERKRPLVVEAPTGVGKSLAYLVPAVTFALERGHKAIVCTHTINLQEQLFNKDIPIVKKLTGEFKAELLKGRGNYLCPNRLHRAFKDTPDLFTSTEQADLKLIYDWAQTTTDGTFSDLNFSPSQKVWSQVCSEPHACTPRKCPPGSNCFYQAARRRMAEADVIILNHTLFFTLLSSVDEELLPKDANFLFPRDFLIVDEAHTMESIAAKQLGLHVSESSVRFELARLYNPKSRKGYFNILRDERGMKEVQECLDEVEAFFRDVEGQCTFQGWAKEFRVREPDLVQNTLSIALKNVSDAALKAGDKAEKDHTRDELHDISKRIISLRAGVSNFLEQAEDDHVYWVERGGQDNRSMSFHSAPIDVAPKLEQIFFAGGKPCVFTSATLGIGDDQELSYFRNRVGARKTDACMIDSPFNYQRQMRLYLVKSMPAPNTPPYDAALQKWIAHFLDRSRGRAFVLFTSYTSMKQTAEGMEEFFEERGWRLLVQGRDMQRHQMLKEFKEDIHSVLFGTDSFWTGVDVPGESLSNVIITKLPFAMPDHPVTASRLEHIEARGGNSFMEYSVPEAILKLRQGVGRLIRTTKDKGICVILDNRVLTKQYGRTFLASMPDCPVEIVE
jgi:ATP-dependent DNA helicase DinG